MRDFVLAQRCRGGEQARILGRCSNVLCVRGIGARRIACDRELIAERPPRVRHVRLQGHGALQRGYGGGIALQAAECQRQLIVCQRPLRMHRYERIQDIGCSGRIAARASRDAK